MYNRFCPSCGTPNPYTAVKPVVCAKCSKPFEAAFAAVVAPVIPSPSRQIAPVAQARPTARRFVGARGRPAPLPVTPEETESPLDEPENEYVDNDEIQDTAQALASTISKSDFMVSVDDSDGAYKSTKLGDILKPYMAAMQADQSTAPKVKSPRKSRKTSK